MSLSNKAQATKARIVSAATELFYQHGYNATGLDKIIKAASVTKGNFYYHFKSKEALATASLDWQFKLILQDIRNKVFDKKTAPLKTLFALLELISSRQKEQYQSGQICGCYFGNFGLELSAASNPVKDKVQSIFAQYLSMIELLLKQAQDEGDIAPHINPADMSAIILGQIEGAILLDKTSQTPKNIDNSITFIQQYLTRNVAPNDDNKV